MNKIPIINPKDYFCLTILGLIVVGMIVIGVMQYTKDSYKVGSCWTRNGNPGVITEKYPNGVALKFADHERSDYRSYSVLDDEYKKVICKTQNCLYGNLFETFESEECKL